MKYNSLKRLMAAALCLCMLLSLYVPSVSAETVNYDELSMGQILTLNENLTWVVCGDSITHNGGWSQGTNSYGEWIEQYLRDIGRRDSVVLTGVGGAKLEDLQPNATTRNGISIGTDDFITKFNPDVVTIKLGMNNRPLGEANFKKLYNAMLDEVYRAAAVNGKTPKVVILTSPPVAGENAYDLDVPGQDSVNRQVAWLYSIASAYNSKNGTHIEVVDLRNGFVNERLVLGEAYYQTFFYGPSDGAIHPNAAGQYLIFKTIAKTLGFYNTSMPIFNHDYQDLNEGYMYVDSTYIGDYSGSYGTVVLDNSEMNKTMPALSRRKQPVLLAYHDFDASEAGTFTGEKGKYVTLSDPNAVDDPLTLEEVQTLKREYSVVIRTKLAADPKKANQALLSFSSNGLANWNNSVNIGMPGNDTKIYYNARKDGVTSYLNLKMNGSSAVTQPVVVDEKLNGDGQWHTLVLVQTETALQYYVDGIKTFEGTEYYYTKDISEAFADAPEFVARIGNYCTDGSYEDYNMKAQVDYFQFYSGALNAEEVASLVNNGGAKLSNSDNETEMNKTMPSLDGVSTMASIEFTNENGYFAGDNANVVDLTDAEAAADPMTFAEAQSLNKSFSVVLRGKFEAGGNTNAGILLVSDNGVAKWNDALTVGIPSGSYQGWLRMMDGGDQKVTPNGQLNFTGTNYVGDGKWHTLVVSVSDNAYNFYVDGKLEDTRALTFSSGIGAVMTNQDGFAARFGRYSDGDGGTFTLKGYMDFFQFYGQALTADQAATVSGVSDAAQMNATMPTLPVAEKVPNLLASADLTDANGKFGADSGEVRYLDLMNDSAMSDKLTGDEVKSMGKEYSVVFRARLENGDFDFPNHAVALYMSKNKAAKWGSGTLMVSFPGKHATNGYYGDSNLASGSGVKYGNARTAAMDGKWHTFAVVQSESKLVIYVDDVAYDMNTNFYLKQNIGSYFADAIDANTFEALFGSYGSAQPDAAYGMDGWFDYVQLYDGALSASQIKVLSDAAKAEMDSNAANWYEIDTDDANWAIAGGQQLIGYQGSVGNRSLLRLLENTARNGSGWDNRDIHVIPFASKGYNPTYLANNYDSIFAGHNYDVFMLVPEVPGEVYSGGHSDALVAQFKQSIETLMKKNENKVKVLWTPIASNNDTVNASINAYADAVRQIASDDSSILLFDSNKFMNERMAANAYLKRNWFEEGMNISPLCALDLACAFYEHTGVAALQVSYEMEQHNLRLSSDYRPLKDCVRDYLIPGVTVSGSSVTVDASGILGAYPGLTNLRVGVLTATGVGTNHKDNWEDIAYFDGATSVTFTAPWNNPVVTVLGDMGGYTYRFKDVSTAATGAGLTVEHYTDDLTGLEVVGAPAIGFSADQTSYNVTLYQYQRNVQIRAHGGDNLVITVNGKTVEPGALSQQIAVSGSATVTVAVSGGAAAKTYTLNLTRPANADIIITEVLQGSTGMNYDMIEIYNASGRDLDLKDYALGFKKDYTDSLYTTENMGKYPYYFTGDDQAFNSRNSATQTYTGINAITRNSTFWSGDNVLTEPESIPFPANSTMILWVKAGGANNTYETLVSYLKGNALTLPDGTKVVPSTDIVALAERPNGVTESGVSSTHYGALPKAVTNFHLEDFNTLTASGGNDSSTRGWLFILKDTAVRDTNASITAAGDDIISAGMFVRPTNSWDMSTQFYYDYNRGMALVRNPVSYNATEDGAPYTSDQYSYATFTTFGAIEYWQKPYDFGDTAAPSIENKTPAGVLSGDDATIELVIDEQEDGDIRYLELYVDTDNDGTYETVVKKDITLITSATNGGKAKDVVTHTETLSLTDLTNTVKYYGFVLDGNNNKAELGSAAAPMTIEIVEPGQLRVNVNVLNEAGEASDAEIEVSITLSKGDSLINIGGNYVVYNAEGASVGNLNGGSGSVTVSNGEALIVKNLPEGAAYTLRVAVPNGYKDLTPTDNLTGKIGTTEGATTVSAQKILLTGNLTVSADIERVNGDSSSADTKATVVITLAKGSSPVELAESYVVEDLYTVKLGETVDNTITLSLADGQQATVIGLPVGAVYTVTATAPDGYEDKTTGSTNSALTSVDGATVALSFKEILVTGDLTVGASVKKVDGAASDKKATVKIDLTQGTAGIAPTDTYQLVSDKERTLPSVTNGTATFTMEDGEKITVKDLPVGTKYTISVTAPEGYENITQTALDGNVAEGGSIAAVAVKEKLITGGLTVNAVIKKVDGADSVEKVTVKIQLAKGDSPVNLEPSYTVVNGSGTELGTTTNGAITVTLGNGEKAVIADLPAGAAYTLTVTTPEGYANESTDATTGNVSANGSSVTVGMKELLVTGNLTVNAAVKKVDGATSSEKITVKIDLVKNKAPIDLKPSYDIVDGSGTKIGEVKNGTATIELTDGQQAIVKDVAEGAAYTVTVTAPEGYENTTTGTTTGNVVKTGSAVDVSAKELLVTGDLTVNATVKKVDGADSVQKVTVKIDLTKGNAPIALENTYKIVDGSGKELGTVSNGTATIELTNGQTAIVKDVAEGAAYTVTVTAPEGYENTTTGATTGNVVKTGSAVTVSVKELLVTGNLTVNAAVKKVDGATSSEKITVKIELVKNKAPIDLEPSYDIVDGSGTKIGEVKNGTATIELTDGQKAIIKDVAVGAKFTVTVTAPDGYEDLTQNGTGNVVKTGSTVSVSVKEKLVTGTLTVKMDLNDCAGADADSSVKASLKIKVTKGDAAVALNASYDILNNKGVKIGTLANGEATVELANGGIAKIAGLPAGASYTVTVTVPEGYDDITTGATTGKVAAAGSDVTIALQEQVKEGQFYISASVKKVDGSASTAKATVVITLAKTNAPVDLADSYDILDENGTKIGSTANGTATLSMADGDKAVIKGLPEGASYSVKITAPTGYEDKTSAAATTGIIGTDSGAVACEVAEILKTGEVSVTAELKTEDGETVTDEKVTVTVTLSKGLSPVELAASYDIVNAKGEKIGTVTNGTATFKLASGDKATIKDLPQGAAFVVSLTTPEGYENTTTGTTSGNIAATPIVVSLKVTEKAPTETTKETDPSETTKAPSVTPPTGDTSGVGVWMVVMAASAVLLCLMAAVMALLGRKSKSRR